jgi:hypothetical protein
MVGAGAVALVILVGGYLFAVSPARSRASEIYSKIQATSAQITERRAAGHIEETRIQYAELFALAKAMPDEDDVPGVLLELSRLAQETGISISSIIPRQATPGTNGYSNLPVEVVLQGDFYDLSDFLYRLRTLVSVRDGRLDASGRLFAVDTAMLAEGTESFPQLQATLMLNAFTYEGGQAAGVAAPVAAAPASPAGATAAAAGATS